MGIIAHGYRVIDLGYRSLREKAEHAVAVHDFAWSRGQVRPGFFTEEEHASHIEGMPVEEGRALLKTLLDHVTRPEFCYRHEWREGDLVVWDNRCVLHRATPFDTTRHKRFMQRTTVSGDPGEMARVKG